MRVFPSCTILPKHHSGEVKGFTTGAAQPLGRNPQNAIEQRLKSGWGENVFRLPVKPRLRNNRIWLVQNCHCISG
jgi:hypothetical protein